MKKTLITSALLSAFAATGASAQVTLYDYTQATSSYTDSFVNGSFSADKKEGDAQTAYQGTLNFDYDTAYDSENRVYRFGTNASGSLSRGPGKGDSSEDSYSWSAEGSIDSYFNPSVNDAFWFAGLGLDAGKVDNIGSSLKVDNLQYDATVGVGYGRVVDATPMAKAIRVVDELNQRGLMSGTPSVDAYNAAAQVIDREDEYESRFGFDEYEAEWVGDVANAIGAKLDAAAGIAIREVLVDESIATRKIGYRVAAGLGYSGNTQDFLDDDPIFKGEADYYHPIDNQTQFSNEFEITARLSADDDFRPAGTDGIRFSAVNNMGLDYELSDEIDWNNELRTEYVNFEEADNTTTNRFTSGLSYEMNSALDLTVGAYVENRSGGANEGTDRGFNTGFTYRLK